MRILPCAALLLSILWPPLFTAAQEKPLATLLLEHEKPSAWNIMLRKGFEEACRDNGFECLTSVAKAGEEQATLFAQAASRASLVLVASDGLHETLRDNAAKFRRVKFGSIDAGIRAANIMSVTFADEQAACLAGNAAAMLAQGLHGKGALVGWLSGEDSPAMRSLYNGFVEGVHLASPEARVLQALVGNLDDEAGAVEKARSLAGQGAKVVVLAAGAGNTAAAKALAKSGVWLIPLDDRLEQDNILGWLSRRADLAARDIVASAAEKFRAKEIDAHNLADGYVSFSVAEQLSKRDKSLLENIKRRTRELRKELIAGSLRLPSLRARTLCDCLD